MTPQRATWSGLTGEADAALYVAPPAAPWSWMTYVPAGTMEPPRRPSQAYACGPAASLLAPSGSWPTKVPSARYTRSARLSRSRRFVHATRSVPSGPSAFGVSTRSAPPLRRSPVIPASIRVAYTGLRDATFVYPAPDAATQPPTWMPSTGPHCRIGPATWNHV